MSLCSMWLIWPCTSLFKSGLYYSLCLVMVPIEVKSIVKSAGLTGLFLGEGGGWKAGSNIFTSTSAFGHATIY